MRRKSAKYLVQWRADSTRKPLLIRGARQVGKSFLIREFGKTQFDSFLEINLELYPEIHDFFINKNPQQIIQNLSAYFNFPIEPGKTLLFFDEIQECTNAIVSLRYFYELLPELHVIGAGSLVDFSLHSEKFNVPVGRIQYLYLHPLSFEEFLDALGESILLDTIKTADAKSPIHHVLHEKLLKLYKDYVYIGGMPEVVARYIESKNHSEIKRLQLTLLQTYRDDFGKYANLAKHKYLQKVFSKAGALIGKNLKYSEIDRETPSRDLKEALQLLIYAGVVQKIIATSDPLLPLSFHAKENHFKIAFLDIGLVVRSMFLDYNLIHSSKLMNAYNGVLTEQFVIQETLANNDPYDKPDFFFWKRDKRGSNAEVDLLFIQNAQVFPIEVKSGKTGRLKSLHIYKKEYNPSFCIRYSEHSLSLFEGILSIPLYMISETERLLNQYKNLIH